MTDPAAPPGSTDSRLEPAAVRQRAGARRLVLVAGWLLVVLGIGWEWIWAPLRPGGSLLVLKVVPLVVLLPLLGRGNFRAYQWTTLIILLYLCEGTVRLMTEPMPATLLAGIEVGLAVAIYIGAIRWLRAGRPPGAKRRRATADG